VLSFGYVLANRVPIQFDVIRDRGELYTEVQGGLIQNVYTLKITNKDHVDQTYLLTVSGLEGLELLSEPRINIAAGDMIDYPVRLQTKRSQMAQSNYPVVFMIQSTDNPSSQAQVESRFIGPAPRR